MVERRYFYSQRDRDKQERVNSAVLGGQFTRIPHRRRRGKITRPSESTTALRKCRVSEEGGIDAASLFEGDIVPTTGQGILWDRPATAGDDWVVGATIDLFHIGGDRIDENSTVWIDDEGYIVSQDCTPPGTGTGTGTGT
jgi:hypothetical protein